jgi:hypothetical protein
MTRHLAIAAASALLTALAGTACGTAEQPQGERAAPEKGIAEPEQQVTEPAREVAPAPEPLPEKWDSLVEALAAEDRPNLAEGVLPELAASGKGELTLPLPGAPTGSGETHTRHGWQMPAGRGSAIGVARWTDTTWSEVKIDVGVGLCPHRGRRLVSDVSSSGTAVAHHAADAPADDPNWFLHVNADANQEDRAGETLSYVWAVFTY